MSAASTISQCWQVLRVRKNSILELRAIWPKDIPRTKPTAVVRHFHSNDFANAAELKAAFESAAEQLNRDGYNIYAPFNEIAEIRGSGVKDNNISKVRFVLIDVDRAGDTSRPASRSEIEEAVGLAMRIKAFLHNRRWPEPVTMSSGNGVSFALPHRFRKRCRNIEVLLNLSCVALHSNSIMTELG